MTIYAARNNATGKPIYLKTGEVGFWPAPEDLDIRAFNERFGHTPQDVAAAVVGSMFGWSVPGASPERYTPEMAEGIAYGHTSPLAALRPER